MPAHRYLLATLAVATIVGAGVAARDPATAHGVGHARWTIIFDNYAYISEFVEGRQPPVTHLVRLSPQDENMLAMAASSKFIFWTAFDPGAGTSGRSTLYRAPRSGGRAVAIVRDLAFPLDLVMVGNWVYWLGENAIGRATVEGTRVDRRLVVPPQEYGGGVGDGLASDGRYLYFTRCFEDSIARVKLSGRSLALKFVNSANLDCPQEAAYANGYLFFLNGAAVSRLALATRELRPRWLALGSAIPSPTLAASASGLFVGATPGTTLRVARYSLGGQLRTSTLFQAASGGVFVVTS